MAIESGLSFVGPRDLNYCYLRVIVDANQSRLAYHQAGVRSLLQSRYDLVTVDLATHALLAN